MLAGAALAANHLLNRTEKGKQLKKDLADNAGKWKEKLSDMMNRNGSNHTDLFAEDNPAGNSRGSGSGSPL